MNCPSDGTTLLMSERQGVEIDYCPECRGIWLDRGELDKILEQAKIASAPSHAAPQAPGQQQAPQPQQWQTSQPRYEDRRSQDSRSRKKKSPFEFLGDLFE